MICRATICLALISLCACAQKERVHVPYAYTIPTVSAEKKPAENRPAVKLIGRPVYPIYTPHPTPSTELHSPKPSGNEFQSPKVAREPIRYVTPKDSYREMIEVRKAHRLYGSGGWQYVLPYNKAVNLINTLWPNGEEFKEATSYLPPPPTAEANAEFNRMHEQLP